MPSLPARAEGHTEDCARLILLRTSGGHLSDSETTNTTVEWTISDDTDLFIRQIDSLADILPIGINVIHQAYSSPEKELREFFEQECVLANDDGHIKTYTVEGNKYFKFRRFDGRAKKAQLAQELVPRTFLVSLVSQFDAFLGNLIRQLFNLKPDTLNTSESTLTFSQLKEFGSMDAARKYIVDREVETVLRKSHADQFSWLENKFGVKLNVDLPAWPVFIELTERRNLFVHSNGIVSHQYLAVCRQHGSTLEPGIALGKSLSVSRQYFETAHECIFEIVVKLAQVLWRKLQPDNLEPADGNLLSIGFELLEEERYRLARRILDFSTETLKKHGKEEHRLAMLINRAQAYKWSGDNATARKIIDSEDWSATGLKFQLGYALISDDVDRAIEIVTSIGAHSEITATAYREWPIFRELRKVQAFSEAFERIFGEPLNLVKLKPATISPRHGDSIH